MRVNRKTQNRPASLLIILVGAVVCIAGLALYPIAALNWARSQGVYATPQEHIFAIASQEYCGLEKVVIEQAGPDAFDHSDPHIWYVTFKIYASSHAPCDPDHPGKPMYYETYDQGGYVYLNTLEGWVWMPEGYFPTYIGRWMKLFHLAGPGSIT